MEFSSSSALTFGSSVCSFMQLLL